MHRVGWGLVIGGVVFHVVEAASVADTTLNSIPYSQSSIGSVASPIEQKLGLPDATLGFAIIALGVVILIVPHLVRHLK